MSKHKLTKRESDAVSMSAAIYLILLPAAAAIVTVAWPLVLPVGFLQLWGLSSVAMLILDLVCAALRTGGEHN